MILTSLAIVGAFLLVFGAFIAKDIVAARRSPHKNIRYSAKESVCSYLMLLPAWGWRSSSTSGLDAWAYSRCFSSRPWSSLSR